MAQDSKAHESPQEFREDILATYGKGHWAVIRDFICSDKRYLADGPSSAAEAPDLTAEEKFAILLAELDASAEKELSAQMVCPLTDRGLGSDESYVQL